LEAALNSQPEILDSAVVGTEGTAGEETITALIVRRGSDAKSAVARSNEILAPHQQIRRWFLWPEPDFPRTSTQKIRKTKISEFIRQNPAHTGNTLEPARTSDLSEIIARIRQEKRGYVQSDASLGEDLHLDSLSRTELLGAIEDRYQIDLDEGVLSETTTVAEIEKIIQGESQRSPETPGFSHPYWSLAFPVSWIRVTFYYLVIYPLTRVMCRVKTRGLKNLKSLETPVVFAANHISLVDAPIIMSALPNRFRTRLAIAMEGERLKRFRYPPPDTPMFTKLRLFLQYWAVTALMNVFPLPKKSGFRKSFEFAGEAVDAGYNILVFPEGEMTKDGKLQKLRQGIGLLADGLKIPIVPVVIKGLYEIKAKGSRFFARPGSVQIIFGEPIFCLFSMEKITGRQIHGIPVETDL